jgi:hypothetical protein
LFCGFLCFIVCHVGPAAVGRTGKILIILHPQHRYCRSNGNLGSGSPLVRGSAKFENEWNPHFIRLLWMYSYFPRNWEFGSALSKLQNFGGGSLTAQICPPQYASAQNCPFQSSFKQRTAQFTQVIPQIFSSTFLEVFYTVICTGLLRLCGVLLEIKPLPPQYTSAQNSLC